MILITADADVPDTVKAIKAGAADFLEKPVTREALLDAIGRAVRRSNESSAAAREIDELKMRYERLTPRERQVFALVTAGLLNKQIAAELGAAVQTVKQHRGRVMVKMEAESTADLVVIAQRLGIRPTENFSAAKGRVKHV
jgi:FixJ family two-component response regulator